MSNEMPRNHNCTYVWPTAWAALNGNGSVITSDRSERPSDRWLRELGVIDPDPQAEEYVRPGRIRADQFSRVVRLTVKLREAQLRRSFANKGDVAWASQDWFNANPDVWEWIFPSAGENGTILCYLTARDAARGKLSEVKPGRFLGHFFPDIPEAERARLSEWQVSFGTTGAFGDPDLYPLFSATEPDDIARVYHEGPRSCMGSGHFTIKNNPTRVYGAGDLAVFYFKARGGEGPKTKKDTPLARVLCWPEKGVFSRIYPTGGAHWSEDGFSSSVQSLQAESAMLDRLRRLGWKHMSAHSGGMRGARLKLISAGKGMAMLPFGDGGLWAKPTDEGFVICAQHAQGGAPMSVTGGYIYDTRVTWGINDPPPDPLPKAIFCTRCGAMGRRQAHSSSGPVPICDNCISTGRARVYQGEYYLEEGRLSEVGVLTPNGRDISYISMPSWWVLANSYVCQYQGDNYRMHNSVPKVELHNGRFAAEICFKRHGGWTSPKTGKHYFSKNIGKIEEGEISPILPPELFDQIESAEYELVEEES